MGGYSLNYHGKQESSATRSSCESSESKNVRVLNKGVLENVCDYLTSLFDKILRKTILPNTL